VGEIKVTSSKISIRCDACGIVTKDVRHVRMKLLPPITWTMVHVEDVSPDHEYKGVYHFCPNCTVTVDEPEQEEPGFVDDVC
jgi:hypothetical protein